MSSFNIKLWLSKSSQMVSKDKFIIKNKLFEDIKLFSNDLFKLKEF